MYDKTIVLDGLALCPVGYKETNSKSNSRSYSSNSSAMSVLTDTIEKNTKRRKQREAEERAEEERQLRMRLLNQQIEANERAKRAERDERNKQAERLEQRKRVERAELAERLEQRERDALVANSAAYGVWIVKETINSDNKYMAMTSSLNDDKALFGIVARPNKGIDNIAFFLMGNYKSVNFKRMFINVDGDDFEVKAGTLKRTVKKGVPAIVYYGDIGGKLLNKLKLGKKFNVQFQTTSGKYGKVFTFSLNGSSKAIKRLSELAT
jgi:hypothetical protein